MPSNTIKIIRTNAEDPDFRDLVALLDQDLAIRDGAEHPFFSQYNKLDKIKHCVVAYAGNLPVACGAIRSYSEEAMEVKRMFVLPEYRGQGIGAVLLNELELWASELGYTRCVLETGKKQPEAIRLYQKTGYRFIPNYSPYEQVETSVCLEKKLS